MCKILKNEEKFGVKKFVQKLIIGDNGDPRIAVNRSLKLDVVIVF